MQRSHASLFHFITRRSRGPFISGVSLTPVALVFISIMFILGCSGKTTDGVPLLSDIPSAVKTAEIPEDSGSGFCRNADTGDDVRGVFDANGYYFTVGFGRIRGKPEACVIHGRAEIWRNEDKNAKSLADLKIDFGEYVFHSESKKAIPTTLEYIGPGDNRTFKGYEAQTTVTVVRSTESNLPVERVPTSMPEPTRTAVSFLTPTKPPTPTSTFALLEQIRIKDWECIGGGRDKPKEILHESDEVFLVKAGLYRDPVSSDYSNGGVTGVPPETPDHYRYWRYEYDHRSDTYDCEEVTFREYPAPTTTASEGVDLATKVRDLADESCRNWVRIWREGDTFLDTDERVLVGEMGAPARFRFRVKEVRPVNGRFALVQVHHLQQFLMKSPANDDRNAWSEWETDSMFLVYDLSENGCRETEFAAAAWEVWPEVVRELNYTGAGGITVADTALKNMAVVFTGLDLTAEFLDVPKSHNGSDEFSFELRFSEEFSFSYKTLRDDAFIVDYGTVTQARRLAKPSNLRWEITVEPDGDEGVIVILPGTADCAHTGAICTDDGRTLSNGIEYFVQGPAN